MKQVKVVFEVDRDALKDLIKAGKKRPKKISDRELDELAKKGAIQASDFLTAAQTKTVSGFVSKLVSAIKNPKVQKAVVSVAVATVSAAEPVRKRRARPRPKR